MAKITVEINCCKTTCEPNCHRLHFYFPDNWVCGVFNKTIKQNGNSFLRLPECKQSEVKDE